MYLFGNVLFNLACASSPQLSLALNSYLDTEQGSHLTKGHIMKKSYAIALLLSVCAASSFAQDASTLGARRVAERDAAYAKSHPVVVQKMAPTSHKISKHRGHRHQKHHVGAHKATK